MGRFTDRIKNAFKSKEQNHFILKARVGWGNEIHIVTAKATYAGSGRGHADGKGICRMQPSLIEFTDSKKIPIPVQVHGFCSTPYVRKGDIVQYEFSDFDINRPPKYEFTTNTFKLKITEIRYTSVSDQFFAEAILVEAYGKPVKQRSLINRIKKWLTKK